LFVAVPVIIRASPAVPADVPAPNDTRFYAYTQESRGQWKYLRSARGMPARIVTSQFSIEADEIDYNSGTHVAVARGHLKFEHFLNGDKIQADHGVYNLQTQEGKFYQVSGTSPTKIVPRPGLLITTTPFYFEGKWAERLKDRYIIHDGFLTDCRVPKPWWKLHAPVFDIIPDDRAIARNAVFTLKGVPMLFLPVFYRPLGKNDRQSGFLTPNIGNSSLFGFMIGAGYYWAINRSYDATYRIQDFTSRGYAHTVDFRGRPSQKSDFNFMLYGVNDRGKLNPNGTYAKNPDGSIVKQGGLEFNLTAKTELPDGWEGKLDLNYLSSYLFRQAFTQSFNEAIYNETDSIGYLQKHITNYTFNIAFQRQQLYESTLPNDSITIQKLPSFEVIGKQRQISHNWLPLWFSFDSSTALLRRQEPDFQTSNAVNRERITPRVTTAFSFKGFRLVPSISLDATHYGDSLVAPQQNVNLLAASSQVSRASVFRKAGEADVDLIFPSLERVFPAPKWLGKRMKHVIEPRVSYKYVGGVDNFNRIIRFDEGDILADTNQVEFSLTNRLYIKDSKGNVNEILAWQVLQDRYFDPTFGGAVVPGQRNVFSETEDLTPFAFISGLRHYSPVVSSLQLNPNGHLGVDWRTDYDPLLSRFSANSTVVTTRWNQYFANVGYREINGDPVVEPAARQIQLTAGYGNEFRKGWNGAFSTYYDYIRGQLDYATTQVSYNTDCCGFSVQFRRFSFGLRNENQFRLSFAVANIGSFGTLRNQDRIF
jgi:LPS-assembly protein